MNKDKIIELLKSYPKLKEKFANTMALYRRKRQRRVVMIRIFKSFVFLISIIILFLLTERTPLQSEIARFLFSIILYVGIGYWFISVLKTLFTPPSTTALAVEIEQFTNKFSSAISSAAEFEAKLTEYPGTSEVLRKLTVADAANQIKKDDLKATLTNFTRKHSALALVVVLAIMFIWHLVSPIELVTGIKRVVLPLRAIEPYSSLEIAVKPQNAVVPMGDNLQISAILSRRSDEIPLLAIMTPGSEEKTIVEMYPDKTATYAQYIYTLSEMQESVDYQISCEKRKSERYAVRVIPRPEVKNLQLVLHQPSYIATSPLQLSEGIGDCSVIKGSKVEINVTASQEIVSAGMFMSPGASQSCEIRKNKQFQHVISVATDTEYSIYMENRFGLRSEKPVTYKIRALIDASPTVELLRPGKDIPFPTSKRIDLKAVAKDDFGVRSMVLYYRIGDRSDPIPKNLKYDMTPKAEFQVEFPWMLDTLSLVPGTKIAYYIEVDDACQPHPNTASTSEYHIAMPSMYDMYHGEEKTHENIAEKLREFVETQKMRQESLTKAYEQIKHEKKLDYETEKLIEKAMEKGKKQQQSAKDILDGLKNLKDKMEDNPFTTPEALEKMQKVNELLNDVLDDEAKKMMEELHKSLQELKIDPKSLEKYEKAFKMKEYMKGLDRTIELLKQMKEKQKMNAFGNEIEDLVKRQQHIASETEAIDKKIKDGTSTPEDESKLKDLANQQDKIKKELEQLQEQAKEMIQKDKKNDLAQNSLMEEVKNIKDKMSKQDFKKMSDEISKDLNKQDASKAKQNQKKMLEFLKSLEKNAKQICKSCSGGSAPQLDLSRFIRKALEVSVNQENLLKQINNFPPLFMRGQRPEIEGIINNVSLLQVQVKQQAKKLENALEMYVRTSFSIDPSILDAIRGNQGILSNIVKDLEDRAIMKARSDQNEIIRKFNKLAMDLMRKQEEGGGDGASQSPMSGMQQFKNLTRRQLSLYRKMMKQQFSPGDKGMMEQLRRMAMEQRKIREGLEKLMRESRLQKNTRGRLQDVLDEMRELETKTLDPELRREVTRRQKRIYEKMLKAQKGIKDRKEESDERQATTVQEKLQQLDGKPLPQTASDSRRLSKDFLSDSREDYPQSYKQLLQDYFKSLSIYGEDE